MQHRILLASAVAATLTALLGAAAAVYSDEPAANKRLLRHLVLYQFKAECTQQQVQEVVDAFKGLPQKIDAIVAFEAGTNVSQEGKSEGFTHSFLVTFRDEAGRDAYLKHPAHAAYVNVVRPRREKVVVFDYWTQE
jgi:Stress responsive A/B Barrel Domain